MKNYIFQFGLLVLLVFSTGSRAEHVSDDSLVAEGARLYSENCGRCHNPRPASDYSKKEWSVVMPHMREKAHMTGQEALAVEAFLDSTLTADVRNKSQSGNGRETRPETLPSGAKVLEKYGCQGCHQVDGTGGRLGPSLDNVIKRRGENYVRKKLLNPKFDNPASAMPQFPLSEAEITALLNHLKRNGQ